MKGGSSGRTDWTQLETPRPEHFDDYAGSPRPSQAVPTPQATSWCEELKGFWNTAQNRWDIEGYTEFYTTKGLRRAEAPSTKETRSAAPTCPVGSTSTPRARGAEIQGPWGSIVQRDLEAVGVRRSRKEGRRLHRRRRRLGSTKEAGAFPDESTQPGQVRRPHQMAQGQERSTLPSGGSGTSRPIKATGRRTAASPFTRPAMMEFGHQRRYTHSLFWNPKRRSTGDDQLPRLPVAPTHRREMPMAGT
ncbi:hypothetical protein GCM10018952_28060 [Streptosporangium vulgare]